MVEGADSVQPRRSRVLLRTRVLLWVQVACGLAGLAAICMPTVLWANELPMPLATVLLLTTTTSAVPLAALRRAVSPRTWLVAVLALLVSLAGSLLPLFFGFHFLKVTFGMGEPGWQFYATLRMMMIGTWLLLLAAPVALVNAALLFLPSSRAAFASR